MQLKNKLDKEVKNKNEKITKLEVKIATLQAGIQERDRRITDLETKTGMLVAEIHTDFTCSGL